MRDSKILGNDIQGNGWFLPTGAVSVANSFTNEVCGGNPRDTDSLEIGSNFSSLNLLNPPPTYVTSQAFGVYLQLYNPRSTGRIKNLTVSSSNSMQHSSSDVLLDSFVELINYNPIGGWLYTPDPQTFATNPRALPVDVTPEPVLWPPVPRCWCVNPASPAPPTCPPGSGGSYPAGTKKAISAPSFVSPPVIPQMQAIFYRFTGRSASPVMTQPVPRDPLVREYVISFTIPRLTYFIWMMAARAGHFRCPYVPLWVAAGLMLEALAR